MVECFGCAVSRGWWTQMRSGIWTTMRRSWCRENCRKVLSAFVIMIVITYSSDFDNFFKFSPKNDLIDVLDWNSAVRPSVHPYVRLSVCPTSVYKNRFFPISIWFGVWVDLDQICTTVWLRPDPRSRSRFLNFWSSKKLYFSRSVLPAILARSSKLMVDYDSMGPILQLVRAWFLNFLPGKLSGEFKLCGIPIFH